MECNIYGKFHCPVVPNGIAVVLGGHLLERCAWEENEAHISEVHLYVWFALPRCLKPENIAVEGYHLCVVCGEEADGVASETWFGREQ